MRVVATAKILPTWEKPFDDGDFEFLYKPLSGVEFETCMQFIEILPGGGCAYVGDGLSHILSFGLKGWKNFKDADGNDVEFSRITKENIDRLPFEIVRYITNHIIKNSHITDDEKKK